MLFRSQKAIKGSVLADHLAHQAVDDYQSMNFEFPDKSIMIVTDCEVPGPDEGPEEGSLLYPKICPPIFLKICQE